MDACEWLRGKQAHLRDNNDVIRASTVGLDYMR